MMRVRHGRFGQAAVYGKAATGGGNDPATTAWIAAVVAAGGTVSGTQTTRVNNLIVAAKAHGWFSTMDRLWLFGGESVAQQAAIDIINQGTTTITGTPTFGASGYTGNGFNFSIDSNLKPSTFSGNYTLNSGLFALYEVDNSAAGNNNSSGTNHTAPQTTIYTYAFATLSAWAVNNAAFNSLTNTAATTQGLWGATRTSSSATALYRNGSSTPLGSNSSDPSTSLPASDFQWLAGDGNFNAGTFSAGAIGGGMTGSQWAAFAADLNAYMTAWGINVF